MTTELATHRCSICEKSGGICMCGGCQTFFCIQHFNEHRQQLSMQFDRDIVGVHDQLLEQINSSADLFAQIDRWEKATIDKVNNAAQSARQQLTQLMNPDRTTLTEQFGTLSKEIRRRREENDFAENDLKHLREQIDRLQQSLQQLDQSNKGKVILVENDRIDWNRIIYVDKPELIPDNPDHARSTQNGITVAGGHGQGNGLNQFSNPYGLDVDDDQTVYIADRDNHRIVEWKNGETGGRVVAGGNGEGTRNDQLNFPTDVIVDKETDSLLICDCSNRRVVRWPRRGGTSGQTIIDNLDPYGLTMDKDGFLYVSDWKKHQVQRWRMGETNGTVVAGGNGEGQRLDQLNSPLYVFVDRHQSVYVSDMNNHRVMKWVKDAKEGIVVAGGQGHETDLTQLNSPQGVIVDQFDTVYVADCYNHRIMRWLDGATQGSIVVDGNDEGGQANQVNVPTGLSFDLSGNLYVVDRNNHRVQQFSV